jgi:hypothetical protein
VVPCSTAAATCPVVVGGKVGNALRFNGTNDYLVIAHTPDLDTLGRFTIAMWMWVDAAPTGSNYACPANKVLGTGGNDTWSICVTPQLQLFFGTNIMPTGTGDSLLSITNAVVLTSWHHVAITWDGTNRDIWYDGIMRATDQSATVFDSNPIEIGVDINNGTPASAFAGILDEVRIYNRALSQAELAALAQ